MWTLVGAAGARPDVSAMRHRLADLVDNFSAATAALTEYAAEYTAGLLLNIQLLERRAQGGEEDEDVDEWNERKK